MGKAMSGSRAAVGRLANAAWARLCLGILALVFAALAAVPLLPRAASAGLTAPLGGFAADCQPFLDGRVTDVCGGAPCHTDAFAP
jgi:hypothetical protein